MPAVWNLPDFDGHEAVHMFTDVATGLEGIIAIHSTHLGPAAGGVRFWNYADRSLGVTDALRLSRGMSYKNAMAGLALGGGKAVILAGPDTQKTPDYLAAYGRVIDSLGGRYVTAEDVGMTVGDMVEIAKQTRHVSGLPVEGGEAGGDPGPFTAYGVYLGVLAAIKRGLGKDSAQGVHVAIQGIGSVGGHLARRLAADGAKLTLADIDADRCAKLADELSGKCVGTDGILEIEADVVSPNALGGVLTVDSIAKLKAPVVAGGANNQLATREDGQRLRDRGIVFAPDYVINAGGIINVGLEYLGQGNREEVERRIEEIPGRLHDIWAESDASNTAASEVADAMAREKIGRG